MMINKNVISGWLSLINKKFFLIYNASLNMVRKQNKHNASLNRIRKQNEHLPDLF